MALPIQIILIRQLAGYLGIPLFLVDPKGDLLFYNEPAEVILGLRFEETGAMPAKIWSSIFTPVDEQGQPIPPENLPLMMALATQRPAHKRFYIHGMNGVRRHIDVVSIPIIGLQGEFLGAASPVLGDPGMRVTLLGTRGSVPAPGPDTAHFGGNTPSVEVRGDDGTVLVLDAGTGIRRLGDQLPPDLARIDILLTHLHMDHIQGLGFFEPLYRPDVEVHIWGPASATMSLEVRLSRYLSPPLFPVHLRDLPNITCHEVPQPPFAIGPFRIQTALVCHPNPTVGYRIEEQGGILAYLPDHEPALCVADGQWLGPEWTSGHALAAGADLLIHDAQFTEQEYACCVGWGHSAYRHAFEFATLAGVQEVVLFHHDPSHDDNTIEHLLQDAVRRFKPAFRVSAGREGAVFEMGAKPALAKRSAR